MNPSPRQKNKDLPAAKELMLLCALLFVALAAVSCQTAQPLLPVVRYDQPSRPIPLATQGRARASQLIAFFSKTNRQIDTFYLETVASAYIKEAALEGINSDIAFCQMVHETNYLRFGGDVKPWQNNFCGLGATGKGAPGAAFSSVEKGVRAHIQHLKAYANNMPLQKKCIDPRFEKVRRGRAPYLKDLTGTWATDPKYAQKLRQKLSNLEKNL